MKLTKEKILSSLISVGAMVFILPVMFWIFNKADKKEVEVVEEKVELVEDINMEQTYLMKEQAFIQQNTVKILEKMDKRIEKLEE